MHNLTAMVRSPRRGRGFWYSLAIDLIWMLLALTTRTRWYGRENLGKGGVLVAGNHLSMVDPVFTTAFCLASGRIPRYLAMAELWRVPVVRGVLAGGGHIPVHRGSTKAVQAFRDAVAAVQGGECVVVFPEGGLGRRADHWPDPQVKNGVARIALESGVPVVPLATWGTQELLPADTRYPKLWPRKTLHVAAGPPVDLTDLAGAPRTKSTLDAATKRIMAAITDLLATVRDEQPPR